MNLWFHYNIGKKNRYVFLFVFFTLIWFDLWRLHFYWKSPTRVNIAGDTSLLIDELFELKKDLRNKSSLNLPGGADSDERGEFPWHALSTDLWLLQRIIYKNSNQHRMANFFQRIKHVMRSQRAFWSSTILDQSFRTLFVALPTRAKSNTTKLLVYFCFFFSNSWIL